MIFNHLVQEAERHFDEPERALVKETDRRQWAEDLLVRRK